MEAAPQPTPTESPKRIDLVDGLRGFALLGILLVNIPYFATAYLADLDLDDPLSNSWFDSASEYTISLLFESKFFILFSFLFGYSFVLQMQSAERQGAKFSSRMLRRLLGLFVLGSLHAVFLWHGDILTLYAVLGLFLFVMRGIKPHVAVIVGSIITASYALLWMLVALVVELSDAELDDTDEYAREAAGATVAFRGSFGDVIGQRLSELPEYLGSIYFGQGPLAFTMFLFGLAAAKSGLFTDLDRFKPWFIRALKIGLTVGLAGNIFYALMMRSDIDNPLLWAAVGVVFICAPLLTSAYVSALVLGSATRLGAGLIALLAPVGRMALSNYVLQSILMGFVFFGYGFGLFGEVGPFTVVMIALAIYAIQIVVSMAWMSRHQYGPLEWLLRGFTYWQRPAWRKRSAPEQPAVDGLVGHPPHADINTDRSDL